MTMNEKLLVVWVLVAVATGLLFHHLLSWAIIAFQKVVAFIFIPLPALVKYVAWVCCMNLLQ